MKNLLPLFALLLSIGMYSCSEDFSPKTESEERYALNCLIQIRGSSVSAMVQRTYDVAGFDPAQNTVDPVIDNAVIEFGINDDRYTMEKRTAPRVDSTRYQGAFQYYFLDSIIVRSLDTVYITATLPNGKTLSASTRMPLEIAPLFTHQEFTTEPDYNTLIAGGDSWGGIWESYSTDMYVAQCMLFYYREEGGFWQYDSIEVPISFADANTLTQPVYPTVTKSPAVFYSFEGIDWAMRKLSEGDPEKSRYHITMAELRIMVMDEHLGRYYSSIHGYFDPLSVRLDLRIYSNVSSGFGVFGGYQYYKKVFPVNEAFLYSYGYRK